MGDATIATDATSTATVLAVWLRPLVDYLERTGFDSAALFSRAGVEVGRVFVPGARLRLRDAAPLWQQAAIVTGILWAMPPISLRRDVPIR